MSCPDSKSVADDLRISSEDKLAMAYDEIADAVVNKRAAILAPSQCELLIREWRRLEALAKHAYEEGK